MFYFFSATRDSRYFAAEEPHRVPIGDRRIPRNKRGEGPPPVLPGNMTTEEKFNAAVNVIRSLPKNGETDSAPPRSLYRRRRGRYRGAPREARTHVPRQKISYIYHLASLTLTPRVRYYAHLGTRIYTSCTVQSLFALPLLLISFSFLVSVPSGVVTLLRTG